MESFNRWTIVIVVVALLVGGLLGSLVSTLLQAPDNNSTDQTILEQIVETTTNDGDPSHVFSSQSATIEGVITEQKNNSVTVKNNQNNQSETFELDPSATVLRLSSRANNVSSSSSDLKSIQLNSPVIVNLTLKDDQYVVVNIAYLPAVPNNTR